MENRILECLGIPRSFYLAPFPTKMFISWRVDTESNSNGYDFRFEVREKSVDVNVIASSGKTAVKAGKSKMYVLYVED